MKTSFHNEFIVNSQQLLYFNIIFGAILLLYFVFGRSKPAQPVKLNLRAKSQAPETLPPLEESAEPAESAAVMSADLSEMQAEHGGQLQIQQTYPTQVKDLAIYFMFNGHEWEAHEVLGIPQGASVQMATQSYQHLIKNSDPSTYEFYELAHLAVLKSKNRRL